MRPSLKKMKTTKDVTMNLYEVSKNENVLKQKATIQTENHL